MCVCVFVQCENKVERVAVVGGIMLMEKKRPVYTSYIIETYVEEKKGCVVQGCTTSKN